MRKSENRMTRIIFEAKCKQPTRGSRKINIEEFHDLYSSLIKNGAMDEAYSAQDRDRV